MLNAFAIMLLPTARDFSLVYYLSIGCLYHRLTGWLINVIAVWLDCWLASSFLFPLDQNTGSVPIQSPN